MSDTQAAFALKATHDPDSVGAVFVNDHTDVNVRELLEQGNGTIVVEDPAVIRVLDGYEPLKRVQPPTPPAGKPAAGKAKTEEG